MSQPKIKEATKSKVFNFNTPIDYFYNYKISDVKNVSEELNLEPQNSKTIYSDSENIYVNEFYKIMYLFKNNVSADEYKVFCEYYKGKKVSDLVDSNGNMIGIYDANKISSIISSLGLNLNANTVIQNINNKLKNYNFKTEDGKLSIGTDIYNCEINEIISSDSGYDAIILVDLQKRPILVNCCTNPKSTEDIFAIAAAMVPQIIGNSGDEFVDATFDAIKNKINQAMFFATMAGVQINTEYNGIDILEIDYNTAKACYNNQINDNRLAIQKCIEIAKENGTKVKLAGYSEGGGFQLTSYALLCRDNPELEDYIDSIEVFNPFVSIVEQYDNVNDNNSSNFLGWLPSFSEPKKSLIDLLSKSDKLTIYSNEEDYVSRFHGSMSELFTKYKILPTQDLTEKNSPEIDIFSLITNCIIGNAGDHVLWDNYDCFDENGNLIKEGELITISQSIRRISGDSDGNEDSGYIDVLLRWAGILKFPTFGFRLLSIAAPFNSLYRSFPEFKQIIDNICGAAYDFFNEKIITQFNFCSSDYYNIISTVIDIQNIKLPDGAPKKLVSRLLEYFKENFGSYSYDEISEIIVDEVSKIVDNEIEKKTGIEYVGARLYYDEETFKKSITNFMNDQTVKDSMILYVTFLLSGNKDYALAEVDTICSRLNELYVVDANEKYQYANATDYWLYELVNNTIKNVLSDKLNAALTGLCKQ